MVRCISSSLPSSAGWSRVRHHLHPSARAGFNVGVVALGILTVVPIIGFLLILPNIRPGLLFDHSRRRRIVRVVWIIGVHRRTPPPWSPSRADKDTCAVGISMPVVSAVPIITTIPVIAAIPVITTRPVIATGPVIAARPLVAAGPVITSRSSRVRGQSACNQQCQ